jgi:hypothetical protein
MKANIVSKLVLSVFLSLGFIVSAAAQSVAGAPESTVQAEVKYTGNNPEFIDFEVNLRQQPNQRAVLRIVDDAGHEMYREVINRKDFNRVIRVVKNDYPNLQFIVETAAGQYKKNFNIVAESADRISYAEGTR